ncbi:MAG: DUF4384 domain-containing protein [Bryobacteraceae bacterium]
MTRGQGTLDRWAKATVLACLFAGLLPAQGRVLSPRDLYLEKNAAGPDAAPAAHHLGLRYTELLVDPSTRRVREAAPDTVFHGGDCLAVEFTPNRSGAVYVLNHGSSGDWQLLLPNALMPDASGVARAGVTLRVPTDYCFLLDGKPGTETLMLAITEREEDARKMRDLLAGSSASSSAPAAAGPIRDEVESWQRLGSRDLRLETVDSSESAGERPNSVYAVMSSAAVADRLVIEIKIRHE